MTAEPPGPPVRKWGNRIETVKKTSKVRVSEGRSSLGPWDLSPEP